MKMRKKTLLLILVVCLLFQLLAESALAAGLQGDDARYTQKVVSVLFDNSGSMDNENKFEYAQYAIQMLMSLLGEKDILVITPMNTTRSQPVTDGSHSVEIDLSKKDRELQIELALKNSFLANGPTGMTPSTSMAVAVDQLKQRGMTTKDDLIGQQKNQDKEYWFVILSDGAFDEQTATMTADKLIEPYISKYASLQTIFLSFGDAAPDLTGCSLSKTTAFFPYKASKPSEIVTVIQKIANRLTGRYTLDAASYKISGSSVVIDLDTYEFSLNSISVTVQNCGASLKSAKYNGKSINILQACEIVADKKLNMKSGYTAVIKGDPYLSGGKLELEFSDKVLNLAVLVEPALYIEPYLEYQDGATWTEADMQYINSHLSKGDQIRVGYRVYEKASGKPIDLTKIFGTTTSNVTYANKSYNMSDPIPLIVGNNELGISVSVMDGTYSLYAAMLCIIEEEPNHYRVEVDKEESTMQSSDPKSQLLFTVYADNKPLSKSGLSTYTVNVTAKAPNGDEFPVKHSIQSDGKIQVQLDASSGSFGVYTVEVEVMSEYGMIRNKEAIINFYPLTLEARVASNEKLTLTQNQLESNTTPITFVVTADGRAFDLGSALLSYKLEVQGTDVTAFATVDGNQLIYVPQAGTFGNHGTSLGEKAVKLTVTCPEFPQLSATAEAAVEVTNTKYTLEVVPGGNQTVDRFDILGSEAVVYFRAGKDGVALSEDELAQAIKNGTVKVKDSGTFSSFLWQPCGKDVSVEVVNGEALVACRIVRDWIPPFDSFMAMLILNGNKTLTATYMGVEVTEEVTFTPSPIFAYIWRILVIILVVYLVLFAIGLFSKKKCRNLPKGYFVFASFGASDDLDEVQIQVKPVNATFKKTWFWHFKRLIFMRPLWSDQEEESCNGLKLKYSPKKSRPQFAFSPTGGKFVICSKKKVNTPKGKLFSSYIDSLHSGKRGGTIRVDAGTLNQMFKRDGDQIVKSGEQCDIDERIYARVDSDTMKIMSVVFFVKCR